MSVGAPVFSYSSELGVDAKLRACSSECNRVVLQITALWIFQSQPFYAADGPVTTSDFYFRYTKLRKLPKLCISAALGKGGGRLHENIRYCFHVRKLLTSALSTAHAHESGCALFCPFIYEKAPMFFFVCTHTSSFSIRKPHQPTTIAGCYNIIRKHKSSLRSEYIAIVSTTWFRKAFSALGNDESAGL